MDACWRGDALGMFSCFPLVNTCLRRLKVGRTTWLPLCFPEAKECVLPLFTLSMLKEGLRLACCGEDMGILMDLDLCPPIIDKDGDTLQGDTRS